MSVRPSDSCLSVLFLPPLPEPGMRWGIEMVAKGETQTPTGVSDPCSGSGNKGLGRHAQCHHLALLDGASLGWSAGLALGKPKQHWMTAQCLSTHCFRGRETLSQVQHSKIQNWWKLCNPTNRDCWRSAARRLMGRIKVCQVV